MPDGWNMLKLKPAEIMDFPLPTYILKNESYTESWQFHELGTPFRVQLYHIHLADIIAVDSLVPETEHDAVCLVNLWQEFPTDCRYVC